MITKEFTIFYYEQFLYLKNYSPLSTSLFFLRNSLVLFPCPPPSSFWGLLCIIFSKSFFFFSKERRFFFLYYFEFRLNFSFTLLLSLSPSPFEIQNKFRYFYPKALKIPSIFSFFWKKRRGREGRLVNLARSFRLNFSKILKVDNISREESLQKREGEGQRLFTAAAIARVSTTSNPRNTWDLNRRGGEGRGGGRSNSRTQSSLAVQ